MASEEILGFVEALLGHENITAEPENQPPAAEVPDQVTDVVAGDGGDKTQDGHAGNVESPGSGEDPRGHQHGLARDRCAEAFDEQKPEDRQVPVRGEDRSQPSQHSRQLRSHPTTSPGPGASRLCLRCHRRVARRGYPLAGWPSAWPDA
jgi:hypothetical protein